MWLSGFTRGQLLQRLRRTTALATLAIAVVCSPLPAEIWITGQQTYSQDSSGRAEGDDWEASVEDMTQLYEDTLKDIQEGEVVKGIVIKISPDYVLVDVGYKSEGQIPIQEFLDDEGSVTVQENDEVDVLLERREDEDGLVVLSKSKADQARVWDTIGKAFDNDELIKGKVLSRIKGGLSVDIGVRAFLPGSASSARFLS